MTRPRLFSGPSLLVMLIALAAAAVILYFHGHLLYFGPRPLPYRIAGDSDAYIKIASGQLAEVESPFSKRIVYPYLVGAAARLFHADLGATFLTANFLCFGLLAYCLAACLENTVHRPYLALIPLFTAFGYESLALGYLPDLCHAAFTCLFFLLLLKDQRIPALIVLFFLCLVRDNTFFLCFVLAGVAWRRKDRRFCLQTLTVLVCGIIVSSVMARGGKPNIHHLADPLYLALKVPYNFIGNVFGIFFWTDMRPGLGTPLFVRPIPLFFRHFAQDTRIGIVLDPHQILNTFVTLLTLFGTGPLFLLAFRRRWRAVPMSLPIQLALVYGILSYFLGVALGNWVFRLIGYGWPAFWLALPFLLARLGYRPPQWKTVLLLACFFSSSWLPSLLQERTCHWTLLLPASVVLYAITFALLRNSAADFAPAAVTRDASGD